MVPASLSQSPLRHVVHKLTYFCLSPGAVGYHADDGKLFKAKGHGDPFGPSCTEGDVMGCGIVFSPLSIAAEDCGGRGVCVCVCVWGL